MIKDVFAPPNYSEHALEGDISVVMLYYVYVVCFFSSIALSLIYVIGYLTYDGGTHVMTFRVEIAWVPMLQAIATALVAAACIYLLIQNKLRLSIRVFLTTLQVFVYAIPFMTGAGIYDPILNLIYFVLVIAAVFLDRRDILTIMAAYIGMVTFYFLGQRFDIYWTIFETPNIDRLIVNYTAIIIVTIVLMITIRQILNQSAKLSALNNRLQTYQDKLELMVIERTDQLNEERDRAEKANQAKSNFLANMSHELRTPLNAIIGYSELIEEEIDNGEEPEILLEDVNRIEYSGRHLLGLINNLLDISKIEARKMTIDIVPINLQRLLDEVSVTVQPLTELNSNRFLVDNHASDPELYSDDQKIKQILINLLSNAFKFTQRSDVRLEVFNFQKDDQNWIEFRVSDQGIGIRPEFIENLFKPFLQEENSSTKQNQGTGLGLAISKQFAIMLGGDISVESTVGQGSTFRLKLPVMAEMVVEPSV
ncbi:MAG: ATP-binding protein [Chloroflexota bacterium]